MNIQEFEQRLNDWGHDKVPFLFVVDFEMEQPFACRLEEAASNNIKYQINGLSNHTSPLVRTIPEIILEPDPFATYLKKFQKVWDHLHYGDSFLTNLTVRTRIQTPHALHELFGMAHAPYKLLFHDQFLVFSPETFVKIEGGKIYTFPMKGTIDANIPGASDTILNDAKELAEHATIVDLMRNDLSRVATRVSVTRFRYLSEIKTNQKNLLQVSSQIEGDLPPEYLSRLGTILTRLMPAGSISGAPKEKTLQIIQEAEGGKRNYYTGVFGYFDGVSLDSAVMIRFIEKEGNELYYRSGGGITTQSVAESEYQEAMDKIYVPID